MTADTYERDMARAGMEPMVEYDLIPAGRPVDPSWYGKRPKPAELPASWIERQIKVGGLTPPSDHIPRAQRIQQWMGIGIGIVAILAVAALFGSSLLARIL